MRAALDYLVIPPFAFTWVLNPNHHNSRSNQPPFSSRTVEFPEYGGDYSFSFCSLPADFIGLSACSHTPMLLQFTAYLDYIIAGLLIEISVYLCCSSYIFRYMPRAPSSIINGSCRRTGKKRYFKIFIRTINRLEYAYIFAIANNADSAKIVTF